MTFGESLMGIRKDKGISRKEFAEQLQIPYTTLRNYETNQREPGHKLLIKMAMLLQVSVDELIGYHAQTTKKSPSTAEAALEAKKAPPYSSEAMKLAQDYDGLDGYGKRMVRMVVIEEQARCKEQAEAPASNMIYAAAKDGGRPETEADGKIILPEKDTQIPR